MAGNRRDRVDLSLSRIPPFSWIIALWGRPILANLKARREGYALLFQELAVATQHGVPLNEALRMVSQPASTLAEQSRPAPLVSSKFLLVVGCILVLPVLPALLFVAFLTVLFGSRLTNPSEVAKRTARALLPHAERGLPLSEAISCRSFDFDESMISILRTAEERGQLPEALRLLADFQIREERLLVQTSNLTYPCLLVFLCTPAILFLQTKIAPKFLGIFEQLGIRELPELTSWMLSAGASGWLGLLFISGSGVLITYVLYGLMNGSRMTRALLGFLAFIFTMAIFQGALAIVLAVLREVLMSEIAWIAAIAASVLIAFLLAVLAAPLLLVALETTTISLHRILRNLLIYLPVLGRGARAERNARWMAGLSLSLRLGVPAHEAVSSAARIAGQGLTSRARQISELIESGHRTGEACARHNFPNKRTAALIAWNDDSPDFIENLQQIAADAGAEAEETLAKVQQSSEILSQLLIGAIVALIVIATYLPLFAIPGIIPYE